MLLEKMIHCNCPPLLNQRYLVLMYTRFAKASWSHIPISKVLKYKKSSINSKNE